MKVEMKFNEEELYSILKESVACMSNIPDGFCTDDDKCKLRIAVGADKKLQMIVEYEGEY